MTAFRTKAGVDLRDSWQWQLLELTRGSFAHYVFRAVLNANGLGYPRIGYAAKILRDGTVIAKVSTGPGEITETRIDSVGNITNYFRRRADELKLSDGDREELFTALRQWMATDLRATSHLEDTNAAKQG